MKKSEIIVGQKYRFNPDGKNRYGAFSVLQNEGDIEVVVIGIYNGKHTKGDVEVTAREYDQTIHWSELKPLKVNK